MYKAELANADQAWETELTECKRVAQVLREDLDLSTAILNTVSALVVVLDCEGYIVRFNSACEQTTGYVFDEVRSQPFWELFLTLEEKEPVKAVFEKIQLDKLAIAYENDWITKDGSHRRIAWSYTPFVDTSGTVKYVISTGTDITQSQQAEAALHKLHEELEIRVQQRTAELAQANQALRENSERYRAFVQTSCEGIWRFELEQPMPIDLSESEQLEHFYRYAYLAECNDMMARMYGFEHADQIVGTRLGKITPANPVNIAYLRAFIRSSYHLSDAESQEVDKQGNINYFLNNLVGIVEGGLLRRTWGTQCDITALKQTEEALRISETRFRAIFEQAPLSIQILAPDGRTLQVNRAFEDLFHLSLSDLANYNILEDRQLVDRGIMPYVQKGFRGEATVFPPVFYDSKQTVPDKGRESWTQGLLYPLKDEDGNIREVVLMHQDITALKQAEQLAYGQTAAITRTLNLLATEPELDKFLGQVLVTITEQLNCVESNLWLYDPATNILSHHMGYYDGRILLGEQRPGSDCKPISFNVSGHPLWAELQRTGRPVTYDLKQVASHPDFEEYYRWMSTQQIKAVLVAPLLLGQEAIGTLIVFNTERDYWRAEETELAQALAQQASLAVQLTRLAERSRAAAVLEERNRIAREIHDTLAQAFTGIVMQLEAASRFLTTKPDQVHSCITRAQDLARTGIVEAQRSLWTLCREADEYSDLSGALTRLVEQTTASTSVRVELSIQGTPPILPPNIGMNLLRIAQEALTNALRHAQAQSIQISITYTPHQVQLQVQDDGQGFAPQLQTASSGFGLMSMRQRAERIGALLAIATQSGSGTTVTVTTPIAAVSVDQEEV